MIHAIKIKIDGKTDKYYTLNNVKNVMFTFVSDKDVGPERLSTVGFRYLGKLSDLNEKTLEVDGAVVSITLPSTFVKLNKFNYFNFQLIRDYTITNSGKDSKVDIVFVDGSKDIMFGEDSAQIFLANTNLLSN